MSFDAQGFWEQRLSSDFSLKGVGFSRLGANFNRWAYRIRGEVFTRAVSSLDVDLPSSALLDIGSGTGFYIELWKQLGAKAITGVDLTETAVERLRDRYPDATFVRADIADEAVPLEPGSYDVVSAMDVMFHIVEDDRFDRAIANVASLMRSGGYFVWSDIFVHGRESSIRHMRVRSLARVTRALREAGLQVVDRRPLFFVMNDPLDAAPVARVAWKALAGAISLSERLGEWAGRAVYPLESRLVASRRESPTTEIMVCRKP